MKEYPEGNHAYLSRRYFIINRILSAGAAAITLLSSREAKDISPEQIPEWNYEADVVYSTGNIFQLEHLPIIRLSIVETSTQFSSFYELARPKT